MRDARNTFTEVYTTEKVRLFHIAYAMCGDQRAAEDAVAEAISRVWPRFRAGKVIDPAPYLRRAVANVIVSGRRRRRSEAVAYERHGPDVTELEDPDLANRFVWDLIQQLPMEQRAVLVLRFVAGMSEVEIAAALRTPRGTVKSRTSRAMQTLRGQLEGVGMNV